MHRQIHTGLLIIVLALTVKVTAQVRRDIFDPYFDLGTGHDRTMLYNLMIQYIDEDVMKMHCDEHDDISGGMIHSDWDFLPFHRTYLEGLEDFLIAQGHPEFVPLPYWDPAIPAPQEFQVDPDGPGPLVPGVHPDCASFDCDDGGDPDYCYNPIDWDPQNDRADYPEVNQPDLYDHDMLPTFPDGSSMGDCCPTGLSRRIEAPYHDETHRRMRNGKPGSIMGWFRSPAAPIFWIWHAYVDDIWKEWEEQSPDPDPPTVDLYMKDTPKIVANERDRGEEPNIDDGPLWVSEDIWVRHTNDGGTEHQNPEYHSNPAVYNYVYVRVRNRGYEASPGGELLRVHWSKASTAGAWPTYWNGSITTPAPMGDLVGMVTLPSIPAGASRVVSLPWRPEDPALFASLWGIDPLLLADEPHHFCLIARIDPASEPMSFPEGSDPYANARNNNHVIWKNLSVVDAELDGGGGIDDNLVGASVYTGDAWGSGGTFDLVFKNPVPCKGNPITAEAEVRLTMSADLWDLWVAGGMQMENMAINREERHQLIVTGDPASARNITYPPGSILPAHLSFNFLVRQLSGQERFTYDMIQQKPNGTLVGGERFDVRMLSRTPFQAHAGPDQRISPNTSAALQALDISEPAIYNWYDPQQNLIHTGLDLSVSPEITSKYKLEVIAHADGMKDYDQVEVTIKDHEITLVAPNPATGSVQVKYRLGNATSAYVQLSAPYSNVSNQYILDVVGDQVTLNLTGVPPGIYNLRLFVNGQPMDLKNVTVL